MRGISMNQLFQVRQKINQVLIGKQEIVDKVAAAIIAGGHILMEDIPGVGKTTLATAVAGALSLEYRRVQFTPDVMPGDILGCSVYNSLTREFVFQKGPVFCNLLLADEINRTSPKTQSALLEVMEEGNVTTDGVTRELEPPFIVLATQNPYGSSGTQRLPESQMDRFMVCLSLGYPAHQDAVEILKGDSGRYHRKTEPVMGQRELLELQEQARQIFVHDSIYEYIVTLAETTRTDSIFSFGTSPRGCIALLRMSRAMAVMEGRDFVTAQDVQKVLPDVFRHRVRLDAGARTRGLSVETALQNLLAKVKSPRN